jgi:hypothetical protein
VAAAAAAIRSCCLRRNRLRLRRGVPASGLRTPDFKDAYVLLLLYLLLLLSSSSSSLLLLLLLLLLVSLLLTPPR